MINNLNLFILTTFKFIVFLIKLLKIILNYSFQKNSTYHITNEKVNVPYFLLQRYIIIHRINLDEDILRFRLCLFQGRKAKKLRKMIFLYLIL